MKVVSKPREDFLNEAYQFWKERRREFRFEDDPKSSAILKMSLRKNWLRRCRRALQLSIKEVARRAGVNPRTVGQIEVREENGDVTLKTMREVADAMGCEFVYGIRPKKGVYPSRMIWQQIMADLLARNQFQGTAVFKNPRRLARLASSRMITPAFRKKQGWVRNRVRYETWEWLPMRGEKKYF